MRKIWPGRRASSDEFIFTVDTRLGTYATRYNNDQFYIPIQDGTSNAGFTVNFMVDWGDGNTSYVNSSNYTTAGLHTYTTAGIYTIKCSGTVAGWCFQNGSGNLHGDQEKMLTIENWGCFKMDGGRSGGAGLQFWGCSNMTDINAPDVPFMGRNALTAGNVGARSLRGTFANCSNLVRINNIANWPVAGTISFNVNITFEGCTKLQFGDLGTTVIDLSQWDVSHCKIFERMFQGCAAFNGRVPPNLGTNGSAFSALRCEKMFTSCTNFTGTFGNEILSWDFSNPNSRTDRMFQYASAFTADISGWDVSGVSRMDQMFDRATTFNRPIGSWDVSNVTNMVDMFSGASNFNQDLGAWNVNAWSTASIGGATTPLGRNIGGSNFQLSTANYDALLVDWDSYSFPSWPGGTVDFGNSTYSLGSAAATARASLVTKWGAIVDGGGV